MPTSHAQAGTARTRADAPCSALGSATLRANADLGREAGEAAELTVAEPGVSGRGREVEQDRLVDRLTASGDLESAEIRLCDPAELVLAGGVAARVFGEPRADVAPGGE